jgi:hypothetical protein
VSDLRTRARTAAAEPDGWPATAQPGQPAPAEAPVPTQTDDPPLPDIEYTGEIALVESVPVHVAWARVMADVQSIRKDRTAEVKTTKSSYRFRFRGIDDVLNAVGPALRRHGVLVMPAKVEASYGRASSAAGGGMRECTATVTYRITGPAGDSMEAQSIGEGLDTSDKATVKACTQAYRVLLIHALTIPTGLDPDRTQLERGEQPVPRPVDYRDEIADPHTSLGRLRQIRTELASHRMLAVVVTNEAGDEETLDAMVVRIGQARRQAGDS